MRLPTITPEQHVHEAARQRNEALYQAFLTHTVVHVVTTPITWVQQQNAASSNARHFWTSRGFRIRTKTNPQKTVMDVWLEPVRRVGGNQ